MQASGEAYLKLFRASIEGARAIETEKKTTGLDARGRACMTDKQEILQTLFRRLPPELMSNADLQVLLADYSELRGDSAAARAALDKAVTLQTTHAEANYRLSQIARAEGNADLRLKHLRRVLLEVPKSERERGFFRLAFFELIDVEVPADALRLAEAFLQLHPKDADALLARGRAALQQGDASRLADSWERLRKLAQTPQQNQAVIYLGGELHRMRKEWPAAITENTKFLREKDAPKAWTLAALNGLSEAYLETANPARARTTSILALKMDPTNTRQQRFLERAMTERGPGESHGPSESEFRTALEILPNSRYLHKAWVANLLNRGRSADAAAQLDLLTQGAGEQESDEPEVWHWKSMLAGQRGVYSQGIIFSQRALDLVRAGKPVGGGLKLVQIYLQAAHQQKARGYFDEAKRILREGIATVGDREDKTLLERQLRTSGKH